MTSLKYARPLTVISLLALTIVACGVRQEVNANGGDTWTQKSALSDSELSTIAQFVQKTDLVPKNYPELSTCKFIKEGNAIVGTSPECAIEYSRSGAGLSGSGEVIEKTEVKTPELKQSSGLHSIRQAFSKSDNSSILGRAAKIELAGEYEMNDGSQVSFSGNAEAFRSESYFSNHWTAVFYFKGFTAVMDMNVHQQTGEKPEAHFTINGTEIPMESWEKYIPSVLNPLKGLKRI